MLKKYPNRRLYENGEYTTVNAVKGRIVAGEDVHPSLKYEKTSEEVTKEVLIQIIQNDTNEGNGPSVNQLRDFIQSYLYPAR